MALTPEDERLFSIAETMPVDGRDLAQSADEEQERSDDEDEGDIDPQAAMRESVRLDVLRILARQCGENLTVLRYVEALQDPRLVEQFAAIADEEGRTECIIEIFRDIAEEALDVSLRYDERYETVEPRSIEYVKLTMQYSRLMLERHGLMGPQLAEQLHALTPEQEEALLRDVEMTPVDMAVVVDAFDQLFDGELDEPDFLFGERDDDIIESTESIHKEHISRMLTIISDLGAGQMSIKSLMRIRTHPELRQQFAVIDEEARDACFHNVFYTIAEHAVQTHPLFAESAPKDPHGVQMNVANYVIRLMERHGIA